MNSLKQESISRRDHRDLVIEALADDEALLRERVASLEADVAGYRDLAIEGIHALRALTIERDRLREANQRLRDAIRNDLGRAA